MRQGSISRMTAAAVLAAIGLAATTFTPAVWGFQGAASAAEFQQIYWGDEVPGGWNGDWPDALRTIAERSDFTRTMSTLQLHEYIAQLKLASEDVHVIEMFTSPLRKVAPAIVLANPRVTSPRQAAASDKPVVFLMGNIHPPESEAAEALLMVARDLATGPRAHILDDLIVMIAPVFNVDGTDTFSVQRGGLGSATPYISGVRENSQGLDLNRDAVKLETVEANGLYRTLNAWDPILFLDGHLMGRVSHGYANTYGTTTVPAAAPGPRQYMNEALFPAVRERVRQDFGLEVFTHALAVPRDWPPTGWSHDRAAWTVEAKFVVNDFGLRNRFAIITETPGQPTFERRIYAQYAYIAALLEYIADNAAEMQQVVRDADEKTVNDVLELAESGELTNFLDGEYQSAGKIDLLAYRTNEPMYLPGSSILATDPNTASGPPEVVPNVDDLTLPVGTRSAVVPRAYLFPAEYSFLADKLRAHDIEVTQLEEPLTVEGEEFRIASMGKSSSRGYQMTVLEGEFSPLQTRELPAGTWYLDMAQPMANAAFYYLEPQARDGFVGWGVLDDLLRDLGAEDGPAAYPIFKMRRQMR